MENKKSKPVLPNIYRILPHAPERGRCITHLQIGWGARQRVYRKSFLLSYLKGQCHEIFDFRFSIWMSFPQAPDYTIRAISNFFETSRRYSQLKVHHRSLTPVANGKNLQSENLHYLFWTPDS